MEGYCPRVVASRPSVWRESTPRYKMIAVLLRAIVVSSFCEDSLSMLRTI